MRWQSGLLRVVLASLAWNFALLIFSIAFAALTGALQASRISQIFFGTAFVVSAVIAASAWGAFATWSYPRLYPSGGTTPMAGTSTVHAKRRITLALFTFVVAVLVSGIIGQIG